MRAFEHVLRACNHDVMRFQLLVLLLCVLLSGVGAGQPAWHCAPGCGRPHQCGQDHPAHSLHSHATHQQAGALQVGPLHSQTLNVLALCGLSVAQTLVYTCTTCEMQEPQMPLTYAALVDA
jgi:hypothetical protein